MPVLLEVIMNDANLNLDIKIESADMPKTTGNISYNVKIKGMVEQRVSMNTDATAKKIGAFKLMDVVSANMGKSFVPWVEPLLPIVKEHMTFEYSKEIKKSSLRTFNNMLISVGEPHNVQLFQSVFDMYIESIAKELKKERYPQVKIYIKNFGNALKNLNRHNYTHREFLSPEQI